MGTMTYPSSIVIRGANWLGDSVITIPAVRALRALFPSSSIGMIAPENLAELWEAEGSVTHVIPFRRPTGLGEKARLIGRIRRARYDLGILFPNSFESALWFYLGRVRERLGYSTCGRGFLLTRGVAGAPRGGHQVRMYLDLVRALGPVRSEAFPSLTIPERLREWASDLLKKERIEEGIPLIGINPGSTYGSAKCWPEDRFTGLVRILGEKAGAAILVVGGLRERALADRICRGAMGRILNMAGRTTVMQLAALIERCAVCVSNDTGPMHLACAVGRPVVAIIGPTDPEATGPLGRSVIVRGSVECAPCLKRECPTDHRCMTAISVEEVSRAVETVVSSKR